MNEKKLILVRVYNGKKFFEICSDKNIDLEDIKKRCIKEFSYSNEDINNINLWFINDDNKKTLIKNDSDLIKFEKEIEPSKYLIKLYVDISNKKDEEKKEKKENEKKIKDRNNNYYENNNNLEQKYEKENKELKKKLEDLNLKMNDHKERFNILNNKLKKKKIDDDIIMDDNLNNKFEDLKIEKINNIYELNIFEVNKQLNNNKTKKIGNKYFLENLEFINNKCKICNKNSLESIYKCAICDNFFLCSNCYKNPDISKIHEHNDFFEIIYPKEVIKQIKEDKIAISTNIETNDTIISFYEILNNIFFENGSLSVRPFNNSDIKNLKQICKDIISINLKPFQMFSDYQKAFIDNELKKLDSGAKWYQIAEKIALLTEQLRMNK